MNGTGATLLAAAALVSAAVGGLVPGTAQAAPRTVQCGQTISSSVTLAQSLVGCTGTRALEVSAAAGTTTILNLGGHTISGTATYGVDIAGFGGASGVVEVVNGTIKGFTKGINSFANDNSASNVTFTNDGVAVYAQPRFELTHSHVGNGGGISLSGLAFTISDNHFVNVTGTAIALDETAGVTIRGNTIDGAGTGIFAYFVYGTKIQSNTIEHTQTGVNLDAEGFGSAVSISGNTISDNSIGVDLENTDTGVPATDGPTTIQANTFASNDQAGVLISMLKGADPGASIRRNTFSANGFNPGAPDSNGTPIADGLHVVTGADFTVAGNTATGNAGYGLWAPTVVDGGHNAASGNGAGQCQGVVC